MQNRRPRHTQRFGHLSMALPGKEKALGPTWKPLRSRKKTKLPQAAMVEVLRLLLRCLQSSALSHPAPLLQGES